MATCCSSCCGDDATQEVVSTNKPSPAVGLSEQDLLEERDDISEYEVSTRPKNGKNGVVQQKKPPVVPPSPTPEESPRRAPSPPLTITPEPSSPRSPEREGSLRSASTRLADMTPEEKEAEKKRMQQMVREFAKEVVAGIRVQAIDPQTGKRCDVTYKMDQYLTKFQLIPESEADVGGALPFREAEMSSIENLYRSADILQKYRSIAIGAEEISDTIAIATSIPPNNPYILLIFSDKREQDKFYTCLKILRLSVDIAKKQQAQAGK